MYVILSLVNRLLCQLFIFSIKRPALFALLKVTVWVVEREPGAAVPAELSLTILTGHLVAALGLLDWHIAVGALL